MKPPFIFQIFFSWEAVWISELISHAEEMRKCQEIMQSSILVITTREDVASHNDQGFASGTQVSFDTYEILHKWTQIPCYSFLDCLSLTFKQELSSKASWSQVIHATQTPFCLSDFVDAIWNDQPLGFIFASLHASAQIRRTSLAGAKGMKALQHLSHYFDWSDKTEQGRQGFFSPLGYWTYRKWDSALSWGGQISPERLE